MLRDSWVIRSTLTPWPSSTSYRVTVGSAREAGDCGVDVELVEDAGERAMTSSFALLRAFGGSPAPSILDGGNL